MKPLLLALATLLCACSSFTIISAGEDCQAYVETVRLSNDTSFDEQKDITIDCNGVSPE